MQSTVTVQAVTNHGRYGKPTYASGVDYKARISYKQKWIRRAGEQQVLSRGEVWINAVVAISPQSRLTLPDNSPGNLTPPILDVQQPLDETGAIHHTKIIFG